MDKNPINLSKIKQKPLLQTSPTKATTMQIKYGFRITHFQRQGVARPRNLILPRAFNFYSLCHLYDGTGWFWRPKQGIQTVPKGYGILITPDEIFDYASLKGNWIEDFICFDGPVANHLQQAGIITTGIIKIGKTRRLLPLLKQAIDPDKNNQINANILLQKFLIDLYLEQSTDTTNETETVINNLKQLLINQIHKWWTVEEMANTCGLSINHFRILFKKHTGIKPKAYVERLKMTYAGEQLCSTDNSIKHIAHSLGYQDSCHFSRVFKRIMGNSPSRYKELQLRA